MLEFQITMWSLVIFYLVFGVLWLWIARNSNDPDEKARGVQKLMNVRTTFFILTLFYLGLAHWTMFASVGYGIEYGTNTTCENVIVNSTDVDASTTTYEYGNSCAGRSTPEVTTGIFELFGWVLFLLFLMVLGVLVLLLVRWMQNW